MIWCCDVITANRRHRREVVVLSSSLCSASIWIRAKAHAVHVPACAPPGERHGQRALPSFPSYRALHKALAVLCVHLVGVAHRFILTRTRKTVQDSRVTCCALSLSWEIARRVATRQASGRCQGHRRGHSSLLSRQERRRHPSEARRLRGSAAERPRGGRLLTETPKQQSKPSPSRANCLLSRARALTV